MTIYKSEKGKNKILELYDKQLKRLAVTEDNITVDIYETAKLSITHSKVKTAMPSNVDKDLMGKCEAPTFVMVAEKDMIVEFLRRGQVEKDI